jgi:hypothetical protein
MSIVYLYRKNFFIKCLQGEEARFRHMLLQMNAGAKGRPETEIRNAILQIIKLISQNY